MLSPRMGEVGKKGRSQRNSLMACLGFSNHHQSLRHSEAWHSNNKRLMGAEREGTAASSSLQPACSSTMVLVLADAPGRERSSHNTRLPGLCECGADRAKSDLPVLVVGRLGAHE